MPIFQNKNNKLGFLFIVLLITILGGVYFAFKNGRFEKETDFESETSRDLSKQEISLDFNGDGKDETVFIHLVSEEDPGASNYLTVSDSAGKEIARSPEGAPFLVPVGRTGEVVKLETEGSQEWLKLDFIAGPHQFETMFFQPFEDLIVPACRKGAEKLPDDCLFYTTMEEGIQIEDLDKDGYAEVVEYVDEYPGEGELTSEEESAIKKGFEGQDVSEFTEGARRIALREKGGRGRTVVWGIYNFDGYTFVPQVGDSYNEIFSLLSKSQPNLIKKSEMSKDSIEYIEFARKFWTKRE